MTDYWNLKKICFSEVLPRSRNKLLKDLQSIQQSIEDLEIKEVIFDHSKRPANDECTWSVIYQFLLRNCHWFFNVAIKDILVPEWSRLPVNKRISELFPNLIKNIFYCALESNCDLDINGLVNFVGEVVTNYSISLFEMCINFLKIFPRNLPNCCTRYLVKVTPDTWRDFEHRLGDSLLHLNEFGEHDVHLLIALLETYVLMTSCTRPDLPFAISYLEHLMSFSGFNSSIKACGFVAAIYNHLALVHNFVVTTPLMNLGMSLSGQGMLRTWVDYKHHRLRRMKTRKRDLVQEMCDMEPRISILDMLYHMLVLVQGSRDRTTLGEKYRPWLSSVTSALEAEIEYSERKEWISDDGRWIQDKKFFKLSLMVVLAIEEEEDSTFDLKSSRKLGRMETFIKHIVTGVSSNDFVRQIFWLQMLEAAVSYDRFLFSMRILIREVVDTILDTLYKDTVRKEVVTLILQVLEVMSKSQYSDEYKLSSLARIITSRYLSPGSCIFLKGVVPKLSSWSPTILLPRLLSMPICNSTLDLASHIILKTPPSYINVRKVLSLECREHLLTLLLLPDTNSEVFEVSFSHYCTLISSLVLGKSLASDGYRTLDIGHDPVKYLKTMDEEEEFLFSLEDLYHLLHFDTTPGDQTCLISPQSMVVLKDICSLPRSSLILIDTFLKSVPASSPSQSLIAWVQLFFLTEVLRHEDVSLYLPGTLLNLLTLLTANPGDGLSPNNLFQATYFISWDILHNITSHTKDQYLATSLVSFFESLEQFLRTRVLASFHDDEDNDGDTHFCLYLHSYVSLMTKIQAQEKVVHILATVIKSVAVSRVSRRLLDLAKVLARISKTVVVDDTLYSTLMMVVRDGFKVHRDDPGTCVTLVQVMSLLVLAVKDTFQGYKVVDFFLSVSTLVHRLMESNFSQHVRLQHALAIQASVMFCHYWSREGVDEKNKCTEIASLIFRRFLTSLPSSFTQALVGHFFLEGIVSSLDNDQLIVALPRLMTLFPSDQFFILLSSRIQDLDLVVSNMCSFLHLWISVVPSCTYTLMGSHLLSLVDTALPNCAQKCVIISKLISFLHHHDGPRDLVPPSFLYDMIQIQKETHFSIALPEGYHLEDLVQEHGAHILWRVFSPLPPHARDGLDNNNDNDDEEERCRDFLDHIVSLTKDSSDITHLLFKHFPYLLARSLVEGSLDRTMRMMTFFSLDQELISLEVQERLDEVYLHILRLLADYDPGTLVHTFREVSMGLHSSLYFSSSPYSSFDLWLIDEPARLVSLVMAHARDFPGHSPRVPSLSRISSKTSSRISSPSLSKTLPWNSSLDSSPNISSRLWCTILEVLISSTPYWNAKVSRVQVEGSLSFLILRHLSMMEDESGHIGPREVSLLTSLVLLSHTVVSDFGVDVHVLWHHQVLYFLSSIFLRPNNVIGDILLFSDLVKLLLDSNIWTRSLRTLDPYVLSSIYTLFQVPFLPWIEKESSLEDSLTTFLDHFQKYHVVYFQHHCAVLDHLLSLLLNLKTLEHSPGREAGGGRDLKELLQVFDHTLRKILTLHVGVPSFFTRNLPTTSSRVQTSVLAIIARLKVSLPPLLFPEECRLIKDPGPSSFLVEHFLNCVSGSGSDCWSSYTFLGSLEDSLSKKGSFLSIFIHIFHQGSGSEQKQLKIRRAMSTSKRSTSKSTRSTSKKTSLVMDETLVTMIMYPGPLIAPHDERIMMDMFDTSSLVSIVEPYMIGIQDLEVSREQKESSILRLDVILRDDDLDIITNTRELKILIQWVLSLFYSSEMSPFLLSHFNLKTAAKVAFRLQMYSATLVLLDRIFLQEYHHADDNNDQQDRFWEPDMITLYRHCFKRLGCQEELSAKRFLENEDGEKEEEDVDSYQWLLFNGKFDILRQLLKHETEEEDEEDHVDERMKVLWRLSRWDDVETQEVIRLPDHGSCGDDLLMYNVMYGGMNHVLDQYKLQVSSLCTSAWDPDLCMVPLIILDTVSRDTSPSKDLSLISLLQLSTKTNIYQFESSLIFNIVSLGRSLEGRALIAKNSMDICDLALSCSRLEYVDLIVDMFKSDVQDTGARTSDICTAERQCFKMAAICNYWNKGSKSKCTLELGHLIDFCKNHFSSCQSDPGKHVQLMTIYGQAIAKLCLWNSTYSVHSANHIRTHFLDPALKFMEVYPTTDTHLLDAMATFLYQQYHNIDNYMHSSEYETRCKILTDSHREMSLLNEVDCNKKYKHNLRNQSIFEESDLNSLLKDREAFLISAFISCIECLQKCNKHDFKIFSLISMWLGNSDNDILNLHMADVTRKIPSYKFLVILPQLCARINSDFNTKFQTVINDLIAKIVSDHPYHSIYNVFVLRNVNNDTQNFKIESAKRQRMDDKMNGRIRAATVIIEKLSRGNLQNVVKDVDLLTDAYIQLANMDVSNLVSRQQRSIPFPVKCSIVRVGTNVDLPDPLVDLAIDKSCRYSSNKLVKICSFSNMFSLVGGITCPKVITCVGSDGVARQQLVKAKDDLRKDAVMQQVFSVVNSMMSDKRLSIRTYKVIATSRLTGIIGWCQGTVSLGDWLTLEGGTGAHVRYRPKDLAPNICKLKLWKVKDQSASIRAKIFKEIFGQIKPVLGYFLLEHFPDCRRWFQARKTFIHSMASNSMVGFIVGLGDRHVQNILLDKKTAEVIHIDFGIAFDQGRFLNTPEMVPFRLTRDLVHAMGPLGVEGRFKMSCCDVLSMLRCQKEVIVTLMEVLLYDPLHDWSLTAQQARHLQAKRLADTVEVVETNPFNKSFQESDRGRGLLLQTNNTNINNLDRNQMAERVILELRRKLSGNVDNCSLNVEGHVNFLIQAAVDVDNLARLYVGWQAYL